MGCVKNINNSMTQYKKTQYNFPLIVSNFATKGSVANVEPHGSGHIHDTFKVTTAQPEFPDYLLQRINHYIFKNIPALTENVQRVTTHLRKKLDAIPGTEPDKEVLTLVPTRKGKGYYKDKDGNFWRIYIYLENTRSYDITQTVQQAYESGKAFGRFQSLLSDLDATELHEIIPHFHDVENRLKIFKQAMVGDPKGRVKEVTAEISFVLERTKAMSTICKLGHQGKLPLRTTHNDTKFNNVLLDSNDEAQCVIDLDTVMPGFAAYDFGDAIRSIVNKTPEDEKDLEKITVDINLFQGFTRGFLKETRNFLTEAEINSLSQGVLLLPFIMGLRFLTDYIDGDNYYKINFPDHNLRRAKAQFRLVEELEKKYEQLNAIILDTAASQNQEIKETLDNEAFRSSR